MIGRARDRGKPRAYDVVMLCASCHHSYDAHELDLYPTLREEELAHAMQLAGGAGQALRRIMGKHWRLASPELLDRRLEAMHDIERDAYRDA